MVEACEPRVWRHTKRMPPRNGIPAFAGMRIGDWNARASRTRRAIYTTGASYGSSALLSGGVVQPACP